MARLQTVQDYLASIVDRGARRVAARNSMNEPLIEQCRALISTRGEASGVALASDILARYRGLDADGRRSFFHEVAVHFDPDAAQITAAAARFAAEGSASALAALTSIVEPPRQELFRRLNQAPGGTAALVTMRTEVLDLLSDEPELQRIDDDFRHLLSSWFNRGFLTMQPVTWSSPASVLEKIIDYEAVHEIADWSELRRRLQPEDRRCYAFFHPAMPGEPLVFVEVALTRETPDSIAEVLSEKRSALIAEDADTAVFYSISNCQEGLRGVSFGHFLIKQVASDLARDLPNLRTFVTLSPAPRFSSWLKQEAAHGNRKAADLLDVVSLEDWQDDGESVERHAELTSHLAAVYFLEAKREDGCPIDPVARFHLGNGAQLERINPQANLSPTGLADSAGAMVNYRYDLARIEQNHEAYATAHEVMASEAVYAAAGLPQRRKSRTS